MEHLAGRTIRGITVQIGGDTKRLNEALKSTGKEAKDIKSELAQVEKLLKLDPTNTELLAQKQALLTQAVEATRQRMDALRQAQAQMERASANQAGWEEAYAPLREELEQVQARMSSLSRQAAQAREQLAAGEIDTQEYDGLTQALAEATARSKELTQARRELEAQFEGGHISGEEYRRYQRDVQATTQELERLERQLRKGESALSGLSAAAEQGSAGFSRAAQALTPLSAAAAGLVTGAVAAVESTEELRSDLSKLENNARMAGVGMEDVQRACQAFQAASDELDSSVEATSNLLQAGFTESNLQKAVEGLAGAYLSFPDTLKIESLADSLQETLATGQATGQFAELMDRAGLGAENLSNALELCTTQAQRQDVAMSYLAATGMQDAYQGWIQNNQALVDAKQAHMDLELAMAALGEAVQPLVTSGLDVLASILEKIAGAFAGLSPETQQFIVKLILMAAAIAPVLSMISSVLGAVSNVAGAIDSLSGIAGKFTSGAGDKVYLTFLKWAAIIAAVVLAITALVAAISVLTGKGDQMSSTMDSLGGAMGGITGGLQGGGVPKYASGTDNHPGGLALVGEQGAELLSLPRGSRVYSNKETLDLLEGSKNTPPPVDNLDLAQAMERGFDRVVRAVEEKDMNTYLDGTRLARGLDKKQQWISHTQGRSLVEE